MRAAQRTLWSRQLAAERTVAGVPIDDLPQALA